MSRIYDIVLYGATGIALLKILRLGFTGKLAARYIAQNCPISLTWAVAGRSHPKLAAVVNDIKSLNTDRKNPDIVIADSNDLEALSSLAQSTKVVISVAGPFAIHGSKLVQACAENGTHYVDITGETPWIHQLIQKYHLKPASSPSIIIPSCGFDSVPSDLGTYLLVSALERKYPGVKIKNVRGAVLDISAGVSGGTIASALNLVETFSFKELGAAFKPFGISPCKPQNSVQQSSVLYDERMGGWIGPWLMSETNAAVVCRTYGLLGGKWGDKFAYKEYLNWGSWLKCYGYVSVSGVVSACLAIPPVRWLAKKVLPVPGDGPSEEKMKNGNVTLKIVAETDEDVPQSGSITCQGDADPAYLLTAMMVVESALTLVYDLEKTEVWKRFFGNGEKQIVLGTPALLGEAFRDRLDKGGLHFNLDV